MPEKISLELFRQIKGQLTDILEQYHKYYNQHRGDDNFDGQLLTKETNDKYAYVLNILLQYDLSDIPFEEWRDMKLTLDDNYHFDFSRTGANIDFNLVKYYGKANFRGCHVKNLDRLLNFEAVLNSNDFDEETIRANSSLFLTESFSDDFKNKYYECELTIRDLVNLSSQQLEELNSKDLGSHIAIPEDALFWLGVNVDKFIQLCRYSPEEYEAVRDLIIYWHDFSATDQEFFYQIKNLGSFELKKFCFDFTKEQLIKPHAYARFDENFPELFIKENPELFLVNVNIPADVKHRYFKRDLTIQDLIAYPEAFNNVPVESFTITPHSREIAAFFKENYSLDTYQELNLKHPDVFAHLLKGDNFYKFYQYLVGGEDADIAFSNAVKEYFLNCEKTADFMVTIDGKITFNVPDWLSSMNFTFVDRINTVEDLFQYNDSIFVVEDAQRMVLNTLGIDNIRKFEQETGFFNHKADELSDDLEMFDVLGFFFTTYIPKSLLSSGIDFKNGNLPYKEFLDQMAICLNYMRNKRVFATLPSYDFIRGEFREKHPEIFMDQTFPDDLRKAFYENYLTPRYIYMHRDCVKYLVKTDLLNTIRIDELLYNMICLNFKDFVKGYISKYGNEEFLLLCANYGNFMDTIARNLQHIVNIQNDQQIYADLDIFEGLTADDLLKRIENVIVEQFRLGLFSYSPDYAPDFLKENWHEFFLAEFAPEELQNFFYNLNGHNMTFEVLREHREEWLPFLNNKSLLTSLIRGGHYHNESLRKYFELFGEEKAIKFGINRVETVTEMMKAHQVDLMKSWYDKTGGKFIPDFVVMQNFSLEEADKFLASGSIWSSLTRIKSFAQTPESREAMLKIAYSFGAFDQDQKGIKRVMDLLTSIPKKLDSDFGYIIDRIDGIFIEYANHSLPLYDIDIEIIEGLLESIRSEKVDVDFSRPLFAQLYKKNDDGSFSLTINTQRCPKTTQIIRNILCQYREIPILSPEKAHQLFGGFEMNYDPDFREFLLDNIDMILRNSEYIKLVASIQKQFSLIKATNSNRVLTWELAVNFVQTNKYTSVNTGNERAAEISAIAGYSQADFNTLQQIYNYGKQRTFSSIPRIEQTVSKKSGNYTYEILRLDDPLAMAIGTLTDCCQELNNCAEVCMEHSMVDKNGRVFVIKDENGNIVSQSWVWRNKDVLCFDNIEIPNKAFTRVVREKPDLDRSGFSDEIYEIYKQAARDLMEDDEKVYKELLESGRITQEQYDGLRLGKVTVGLGYNDIAESLKAHADIDKGVVSRPLPFEEPVKLSRGLYTSDSMTQYILEEREDRKKYNGETLPVHNDIYVEYTDANFTEKTLLTLQKLEIVTKENPSAFDISTVNYEVSNHIVSDIARNYDLNPETTRIIMNPNFAIIYADNGNFVEIGDLLFNTRVDNENQQLDIEKSVVMQIRLALEQIAKGREIDISKLSEKQKEMYAKATSLTDELDIERGVGHAK